MSRWSDNFHNHAVHENIRVIHDLVMSFSAAIDQVEILELKRLQKTLSFINQLLRGCDPEITPTSVLDLINGALEHPYVKENLGNFDSDPSVEKLVQANDQLSTIFPTVLNLKNCGYPNATAAAGSAKDYNREMQTTFENFLGSVAASERAIQSKMRELDAKLSELIGSASNNEAAVAALKSDFDLAKNTWQTEFSNDQSNRETAFNTLRSELDSAFSSLKAAQEADFNSTQKGRQAEHESWFSKHVSETKDQFTEIVSQFSNTLKQLTEDASAKHTTILELHELVAGDAVTAGYLGDGKKERQAANFWRWTAIGFIIATIAWLLMSFALPYLGKVPAGEPWEHLVRTASLTGVLMFGAAYASRQSKSHRDQERKARWFGLEVKAFAPFISSLPESQQLAMREKFADRMFAQKTETSSENEPHVDKDMLQIILDAAVKMAQGR